MVMIVSVSDVPTVELVEQLRRANAGLRDLVTARDAENAELRAMVHALGLQVEQLQRRLGSGSDDSGTPTSTESIEAKACRRAEREARLEQQEQEPRGGSSRQRATDRPRGGQPGHPGHGLRREPNPNQRLPVDPPAECRGCGDDPAGAADAGTAWSQIWDGKILPWRTEYLLPRRRCACTVTTVAQPPDGGLVNGISFGPVLNTADESAVQVVTPAIDPDTGQPVPGSPHVLAIRTPDERLAWPG